MVLTGIVVWSSCLGNSDPPTATAACAPISATCCATPVNVNCTGGQSPISQTDQGGDERQATAEHQAAPEAMRAYTEIAKNSEQFYEDAFNQIVWILGLVGVVIGVFLFSEHKSFNDLRKSTESKVDNLVSEAVNLAGAEARRKFEEQNRGLIRDVKTMEDTVKESNISIKKRAASAAEAMSMLLSGLHFLQEGQLKEHRIEHRHLAPIDFENAARALAIAEKFWLSGNCRARKLQ